MLYEHMCVAGLIDPDCHTLGASAPTCAVCCMTADAELGVSSDSESDDDDDSVDDKLLSCAKCGKRCP